VKVYCNGRHAEYKGSPSPNGGFEVKLWREGGRPDMLYAASIEDAIRICDAYARPDGCLADALKAGKFL